MAYLYWYNRNVILALNFPSFGPIEVTITQLRPFLEIQIGSLCSRGWCFPTSLMFLSPIFPIPNPYTSFSIYSLPLVGLSWWRDFPMSVGPSTPYSWLDGTHCLLLMWLPSNLCLMPVTARWVDSPKALSLVRSKLLGHLGRRFDRPLLIRPVG